MDHKKCLNQRNKYIYVFRHYKYIEHYRDMPKETWGQDFLDDFDIEIITMFN